MNLGRWASPAKLNLCLHITGRYDNGYHALQSAFVPITLCDTITIHRRGDQRIERAGGLPDIAPEADLAIRASRQRANDSGAVPYTHLSLPSVAPDTIWLVVCTINTKH